MRRPAVTLLICVMITGAAWSDSLFKHQQAAPTLIAKDQRIRVGDLITVLIEESIDSSVASDTNTKKESDVLSKAPAANNEFLIAEGEGGLNIISKKQLPNWDIQAENEMKARGQTRRATEVTTSMSCIVTHVFPNGLIAIQGEKNVSVNREDSRMFLSGLIRARDITPANTVTSHQIANAKIELKGCGPLWNNQRRGIITRILDWFSPF